MAIWRGTGGSGESTNDSTINAATALANQAAASATAAAASETAAEAAQTAAEQAETNAETAETNAETAATNAATSATSAASSATAAASSAAEAAASATDAETAAALAATYTPSPTGSSGKFLTNNGTTLSWGTVDYSALTGTVPTWNQNTTGSAASLTTGRTIAITGDLAYTSGSFNGSGNVTGTGTLATVNSDVGSYGSSTSIPVVTVNAKGLVTGVSTATVAGGQYFGSASTKAIAYNSQTIAENVTVTAGNSGLSAGPITISSGYAVTVESGSRWVIL